MSPKEYEVDCVTPIQNKVVMRQNRRNSDRPWSVSCISQLTRSSEQNISDDKLDHKQFNAGLANFSISESALDALSPAKYKNSSESNNDTANTHTQTMKSSDSKSSLRKRRMKLRKRSYSTVS